MKSIATRLAPSFAAAALTFFAMSGSARADALPPDSCASVSDVGQTCTNAGPSYDQAGVCVSETCHSASPPDGGSDYPCALCEVSDAGSSGTDGGSSGDSGATTVRVDGGSGSAPSSSSSGCSATPESSDGTTGFVMLVLGMVGLSLTRKKRA
jgi:hypothetical protein